MSRSLPPHGHPNRYAYGCRCQPCTRAATRADAERRLDRMAGRPRSVPVEDVLPHLTALAKRLTPYRIAQESGVEYSIVRRIFAGEQKTVLRRNAQKLLALPVTVEVTVGVVPALGATRRLRALYALGHYNRVIAEESGISRDAVTALVSGQWKTLRAEYDRGIRRAYDRLSMTVGTSWKTRRLAEGKKWAPPLAWDDAALDDPTARPRRGKAEARSGVDESAVLRALRGERIPLNQAERARAVEVGVRRGMGYDGVAEVLGMTRGAVQRSWLRTKADRAAAGLPVPTLRVDEIRTAA